MNLIERDTELATLHALFAEALDGRGKVAVISGSVGSGKTALFRFFTDEATTPETRLLAATAIRAERKHPLGVVLNLFRDLAPAQFHEEEFRATAATRLTRQILDELCRTLLEYATHTPLIIGIDDVHHADTASLRFLLYLSRRLKTARILMILTESNGPWPEHRTFHADLLSQPHCRQLRLNLLTRRGQTTLLATHFDSHTARRLAPNCHALTGGSPQLVHALLKDNRPSGRTQLTVDTAYTQAVLGGLHRGLPAMGRVARALAVLRDPASARLLGRLVELTSDQVADVIEAMNAAGLLDAGRFRHPAARAAVLDGMTSEESAVLHARAARLLHEDGAAPAEIAAHLTAAGAAGPWAIPVLADAADQAMIEGKPHTAVSYLRLAMAASPDDRDRAKIASALARAEWRIDPASVTRLLPTLITAARERRLGVRQVIMLLHYLMWCGRAAEAKDVLDRLSGAAAHPWEPGRELEATRLLMACVYPGLIERPKPSQATEDRWNTAPAAARRFRAATALAAALTGTPEGYDVAGTAEQVLRGARLGDTPAWAVVAALVALICSDGPDIAARWCDLLMADSATLGKPVERASLLAIRAMICIRQGDPAEAEWHARAALSRIVPASWGVAIGVPIAAIVLAATAMGRYEDAATYLGATVPEAMFETPYVLPYLLARGRYHLATGHPAAALQDLRTCDTLMDAWGFNSPGLALWRTDAAQSLIELGRPAEAAALIDEQLARAKEPEPAFAHYDRGRQGPRPPEPAPAPDPDPAAELTEAERRVAGLAAQGRTNREIATALGITVSTVEQHLTRVYRKLRVRRRSDLRTQLRTALISEFIPPEER